MVLSNDLERIIRWYKSNAGYTPLDDLGTFIQWFDEQHLPPHGAQPGEPDDRFHSSPCTEALGIPRDRIWSLWDEAHDLLTQYGFADISLV